MRAGLGVLGRGRPRKVRGVPQPPGPRPLSFLQETVLPGSPNVCSVGLRTQSLLGRLCSPAFTLEPGDETQEFGACLPVMMTRWLHYLVSLITSGEKPPESLFFSQPILPLSLAAK